MEVDDVLANEELKSRLAAVGAGILVIIAGFLVYNYFSRIGEEQVLDEGAQVNQTKEQEEQLGEEEIVEEEEETVSEVSEGEVEGTAETGAETWVANDYKEGDITGDEYTVQAGDTLWEIAEARYGSGFEWTKIRDANSDQIGTLPDGTQALIEVGQTLTLP
ncbi:MAG: LysM peptidoglycan-binding domain-containing protein [Patescibacteria group bacterium]|nr:LysM peptidoglycan-binding domain-containing protein [Patescibacteria group bacterium]